MPGNPSSRVSLPKISDELRDFGFSKDCKFNETQVVLALVTTTEGLPVTYRLFPGNIYEGHTLITMVEEIKKVYEVDNILLVADRAMFSKQNLAAMYTAGIKYIVAARLRRLLHAQASILVDTATNKKYIIPSKTTPIQKIYHIAGLKRPELLWPMT